MHPSSTTPQSSAGRPKPKRVITEARKIQNREAQRAYRKFLELTPVLVDVTRSCLRLGQRPNSTADCSQQQASARKSARRLSENYTSTAALALTITCGLTRRLWSILQSRPPACMLLLLLIRRRRR